VDEVVQYCAGLDVHRGSETKTFGTDTAELVALGDWLISHRVTRVGLESTGVYWKPVFYLLEDRIEQVWLLNAQHLKNVPGRKTDLLTELPRDLEEGCVRRRVRPVRFAARDQRWGCAAGVGWAGVVAAGLSRGDGRSVPAVSAR
jgi:transposase